ncbi:MAG TPA: PBP1A family penicillin-binding protein [Gemmatimonadaceae bacterium]|nr:PBP1A family penicillin-binding protein [Gemmatimonadaceae bacterium]
MRSLVLAVPLRRQAVRLALLPLLAAAPLAVAPLAAQQPAERATGDAWRIVPSPQSSQVLARDGSLIGEIGREVRTSVPLRTLPTYVPQAFIAVEDKRFYQHDGVDVVGIAGALRDAVLGDVRGASTITQLLVGNMHPDLIDRRDRSIGRKLREQAAAREMERHYSKEQILEAFLNQISFGHGWYGIDAAARRYFGVPAAKLSLAQAATLAALPKGPAIYDPIRHPDRAKERRDLVLGLMAEQGFITRAQATAARRVPVRTVPNGGISAPAPYVVDMVKTQAERAGVPVARGGYRIHTTLDPALQRAANGALEDGLRAVEGRSGYKHLKYAQHPPGRTDYLQGAVVALDPSTGEVRALVGGRNYAESQFNRVVNGRRQPGSAFKPFVYATAIADSMPANSIVADTALAIPMPNGTVYRPDNADHRFQGAMTMREALVRSRNPVAVELGRELGMERVAQTARAAGVDTPIAPYPSSAIGASVVQPLDLVAAYAAFATLGVRVEPRIVLRVEDASGNTVWAPSRPAVTLAMDPGVAFIVRDMMRDAVTRGTGQAVRRVVPAAIPVAGKTGTTNNDTDVWFVGMTPDLVAGVWLGFDTPRSIIPGSAGGTLAGPVFGAMVAEYYGGRGAGTWTPPSYLVAAELDRATGEPATPFTPLEQRYVEYFLPGTEPGALRVSPWKLFQWGPLGI